MNQLQKVIHSLTDELFESNIISEEQRKKIVDRVSKGKYIRGTHKDIKEILIMNREYTPPVK